MDAGLVKIAIAVITFLIGATFLKIVLVNRSKNKSKTIQKGNTVFGDQAGRDINKNKYE